MQAECPTLSKLDKADPELLFHAIAIVMARYFDDGRKPGAGKWEFDTRRYRPQMVADVAHEWSTLAGTDFVFPWHDDFVAEVWAAFRRETQKQLDTWEYFGVPVPKRFD